MGVVAVLPIALYYFVYFAALGILWPYFSIYLQSIGLRPTEISRLLAFSPVMGLLAPPIFGLLADARQARGRLLRVGTIAAALFFSGFLVARSDWMLWVVTAVFFLARAPLIPLVDASALEHVRSHGGSYGRLRVWGSLGFLVAVEAGGYIMEWWGAKAVLLSTSVGLFIAAGSAFAMPAPPPVENPGALRAARRILAADAWPLVAAIILGQVGNATYDACFSLQVTGLGYKATDVGTAWAIGTGAEVLLMLVVQPIMTRLGASRLFALSLAVAALRWFLLGRLSDRAEIFLLQPLHGITFGFFYVAGVTLMKERGGHDAPSAAQGLFAALNSVGATAGMWIAGPLFERAGARSAFGFAAAAAGLGAACALAYRSRENYS
jgi:PPP family 3-phenylpropionic acid transporter